MHNPFKDAAEGLQKDQPCVRFTVTVVVRQQDLDADQLTNATESIREIGSLEVVDADLVGDGHPEHLGPKR